MSALTVTLLTGASCMKSSEATDAGLDMVEGDGGADASRPDSGPPADAGERDGGASTGDAGETADSGSPDAATPSDGGQADAGTTPLPPTGLLARATSGSVALSWNPVSTATSYTVYRSEMAGAPGTAIASLALTAFTDTSVVNGLVYYYTITARNASGESAPSTEVSASPVSALSQPTNVVARARNAEVVVSWLEVSGATGYNLYRSTSAGVRGPRIGSTTQATIFADPGLTNGTTYFYQVTATNGADESAPSAQVSATPAVLATPAAPRLVAGNAQISLTWSAVFGATSYKIYRSSVPGVPGTLIASPASSPYLDTGLVNGQTYSYNLIASSAPGDSLPGPAAQATTHVTLWARSTVAGSAESVFRGVAFDAPRNAAYAVGYQYGTGVYDFGNSTTASSAYAGGANATIVKYDTTGSALWARTTTSGNERSSFEAVTVDALGNVYAVGQLSGFAPVGFGNGSVLQADGNAAILIVKYDPNGTTLWARTTMTAPATAWLQDVAVDGSGNVYAAGVQYGTGMYVFQNGVSAQGTAPINLLVVKYDAAGTALWARTTTAGTDKTYLDAVAVDSAGNVYVAGQHEGTGTMTYGPGVSATGVVGLNPLLVKYNSSGVAQWARTMTAGPDLAFFNALAVDANGQVFAAGQQYGSGSFNYGGGASAAGSFGVGYNLVLVKFDAAGNGQWARSTSSGPGAYSAFSTVTVDAAGNVYAAGYQGGRDTLGYGGGIIAKGANVSGDNAVLVRYDATGLAQWARVGSGSNDAHWLDIAAEPGGRVYAAGRQSGSASYSYGDGISVSGKYGAGLNPVLVQYR